MPVKSCVINDHDQYLNCIHMRTKQRKDITNRKALQVTFIPKTLMVKLQCFPPMINQYLLCTHHAFNHQSQLWKCPNFTIYFSRALARKAGCANLTCLGLSDDIQVILENFHLVLKVSMHFDRWLPTNVSKHTHYPWNIKHLWSKFELRSCLYVFLWLEVVVQESHSFIII